MAKLWGISIDPFPCAVFPNGCALTQGPGRPVATASQNPARRLADVVRVPGRCYPLRAARRLSTITSCGKRRLPNWVSAWRPGIRSWTTSGPGAWWRRWASRKAPTSTWPGARPSRMPGWTTFATGCNSRQARLRPLEPGIHPQIPSNPAIRPESLK